MELAVRPSILPTIIPTDSFPSSARESGAVPLSPKTLPPPYKFELRRAAFPRFRLLERQCLTRASSENEYPSMPSVTFQESSEGNTSLLDTPSVSYQGPSMETEHRTGYVAVLGQPNVGKSTLCNQIVGQRLSIVTDKPQTTRHRILGVCSAPDHQIILYDTPGIIKKSMHKLDLMMMRSARAAAWNADCVMVVVDASTAPQKMDDIVRKVGKQVPILVALNKRDLVKSRHIISQLKWYECLPGVDDVIPISAKNADGVEDLKLWILSKLPLGPPLYPKDIVSERPERFFIAEIVREKVFMYYRDEIPYSCRVDVVAYVSHPQAKDFIKVEITVEKRSQIGILIGHGGNALRCISIAANSDIEKFVEKEVNLEIKVLMRKKWRKDEENLKGYV